MLQLLLVEDRLPTYSLLLAAVCMRHNTMLLHIQPRVRMLGMLAALPAADIGASLVNKNIYCLVVSGTQDTVVTPHAVADSLTAYPALAVTRTLNVTHSDFVNGWSSSNGGSGAVVSLIPEIATGIGFMQYYAVMPEGEQYMDSTDEVSTLSILSTLFKFHTIMIACTEHMGRISVVKFNVHLSIKLRAKKSIVCLVQFQWPHSQCVCAVHVTSV
jgi:hypothetical protein